MNTCSQPGRAYRCAVLATAIAVVLRAAFFLFIAAVSIFANTLEINRDGSDLVVLWEGDGILQSADDVTGPWRNELGALSPHRIAPANTRSFYRIFYPFGFNSLLEPPELAFGEPNAAASVLAHELTHVVQQRGVTDARSRVNLFSGEVLWTEVDLQIKGRGLDFIWARKYRSRKGLNTAQGNRWDFSYNICIQRVGAHIKVFDGNGRADVFLAQPDGTYAAGQFFREGRFDSNGVFRLTFADKGVWEFRSLTAVSAPGKISRIADRNGNALTFSYDGLDRLSRVTDTLDRNLAVGYNADGFIASVTDFIGRQVRYAYYQDADPGGSFGDLKSATSPIVTNTPTGNDFPSGKTTTYAYTENFADDRANHLLTTVTSPEPQITHDHVYQHNQSDLNFLRVTARRIGNAGEVLNYTYVPQTPSPSNGQAMVKTILNDRVGNVSEHFYDAGNRLVLLREFTGRAVPGQPTTETLNRPVNPLRTNDPPFFETSFEWNADSLLTRAAYPNGNSVSNTYELAVNPVAARRSRGNLRTRQLLPGPLGGDQTNIVERFEYNPGVSNCCDFNFVTRHSDARSNDTFYAYDERGNCTNIIHRIPSIVENFEYNQFGQITAYIAPDNGSGHRIRFNGEYYTAGVQHSYLYQVIADADSGGLNLTTMYEYDAVGNVTRVIDPRGNDSLFTYNALDQLVRAQSPFSGSPAVRYGRDYFCDANDNVVRVDIENRDENGTLVSSNAHFTVTAKYDVLNCCTQLTEEISLSKTVTNQFGYDANRNLTLIRFPEAVNGNQPQNALSFVYDERDLLFQETRAPGSPDASTTFVDYDFNANVKRVAIADLFALKPIVARYDGFDRMTEATDAMGNAFFWHHNPNGNVTEFRVEGELADVTDGTSNTIMFAERYAHDPMDRLISKEATHFDPATQTPMGDGYSISLFTYTGTSLPLTVTDDNNHTTRYTYDRANRLASVTDPKTNAMTYTYDAAGNRIAATSFERSGLGNPAQVFTTRYTYDALNRLTRVMDNVSNAVQYAYDSRNNPVLMTDALGVQTRRQYEGSTTQTRQITVIQDMNNDGASATDKGDIVIRQVWDDSSRLIQRIDDNDSITTYSYDALNRLVRTVLADGTATSNVFDIYDNVVMMRDANSNVINYAYDLLNRVTNKTIVTGPGVSSNTTFERFAYDGLSRLVRAQNDGSTVEFAYDSLGNMLRQRANGQTNSATFDGVGNMISCVYPGGRSLQYTYDANDNQTRVQEGGVTVFTRKVIGPARVERQNNANRTQMDFLYDGVTGVPNPAGDFGVKQLIRTTHSLTGLGTIFDDRSYRWDPRYSKSSRNDLRPTGPMNLHQYSYDAADQLIRTMVTQPSIGLLRNTTYGLDGAGNRSSVTNNGVGELYTRNATAPVPADFQVNQYTTVAGDPRRYDENGNLTRLNPGMRDERQLEFDYADRLVRVIDLANQQTNQFAYDALGRRIRKTVSEQAMPTQAERYSFWFDGNANSGQGWQLVEEQNSAGGTLATYLYDGLGGLVQMRRGSNDYFYHGDDLGNVMALTDDLGNVAERYEYADFGAPQFFDANGTPISRSTVGNPYLFNGLRYDSEITLYYLEGDPDRPLVLGRTYNPLYLDPVVGRFVSRNQSDGLGNALTFADNNPWSLSQKYTMFTSDGMPVRANSSAWEHQYEYRPGKWAQTDYNFESPSSKPASAYFPGNTKYSNVKLTRASAASHRMFSIVDRSRSPSSDTFYGTGVYKSTDSGKTWSYVNPKGYQIISAGRDSNADRSFRVKVKFPWTPAYGHLDYLRQAGDPSRAHRPYMDGPMFRVHDDKNAGHVNWYAGAYTGPIYWGEHDNDYDYAMITLDRDVRSAHPDFAWGPTRNPSNQGWGKWEISLGTAAWPVYFNPKELTIDRSVPWEKYK